MSTTDKRDQFPEEIIAYPETRIVGWLLQRDTPCEEPGCTDPATVLALLPGEDYRDTALCNRHIPAGTVDKIARTVAKAISM